MNETEKYVQDVLRRIWGPEKERQRIEADLRAHMEEATRTGEPVPDVLTRMGTPQEVAAEFMAGVALPYSGFWFRLWAFLIDLIAIVCLTAPLAVLCVVLSNLVPQTPQGMEHVLGGALILAVLALGNGAIACVLLYFPLLEGRFGQTVGKRLLGLRVLRENGLPIGYKEAFLRRLSFYFDIFAVDALFIPFTPRRQRAFDMIARTVVIREAAFVW